jgi:hypothetical protein
MLTDSVPGSEVLLARFLEWRGHAVRSSPFLR